AKLHIAQGHWSGGKLIHVHRKVYLPTYGIFDDGRYFGPGDRFDTYRWAGGTTGVAICEDLWHVSTPYLYAAAGATIVLAPSASPGRGVAEGGDLGTAESCRLMDRFYAQYLTLYVAFVNRVGHEDGIAVWGGSESAVPVPLAGEALGAENVLGLFTPYRHSSAESRAHAKALATKLGFTLEEVPITKQIEAYFADNGGDTAHRVRVGNKMARE